MKELLPFELVTDILARVRVKDLIRLRCVCKSWRMLFQDERFIRQQKTYAQSSILCHACVTENPLNNVYEYGKSETMTIQAIDSKSGDNRFLQDTIVIGHCDGLLCLHFLDTSFAIWNPALRELRKIPAITAPVFSLTGFGYDHTIQDYKIITVVKPKWAKEAQVLTVKSNKSRMIDFSSWSWAENCIDEEGILVGENIFWLLYTVCSTDVVSYRILSFNLVSETFNYFPSPLPKVDYLLELRAFRKKLCIVDGGKNIGEYCGNYEIWCAEHDKEEKGRIKSWSIILRLTLGNIPTSIGSLNRFQLGNVLLTTHTAMFLRLWTEKSGEERICSYNFKDKTVRLSETNIGNCYLYEYIETLVSPRGLVL